MGALQAKTPSHRFLRISAQALGTCAGFESEGRPAPGNSSKFH